MKPMTLQEIKDAIDNTIIQEALFRLADDPMNCAYWILERVKLRAQLTDLIMRGMDRWCA